MTRSHGRSVDRRPFPLAPLMALAVLMAPSAVGSLTVTGSRTDVFEVEMDELLARPTTFVGQVRRLPATFARWSEGWNPFLTRFGPDDYRAFETWSDAQFLWEGDSARKPALRLFVRRASAMEWALEEVEPHTRFEFTVAVREVFAGEPWCEVLTVRPLPEALNEGALVHAERAYKAMELRQWRRAEAELERALAAPLPQKVRAELERLRAICDRAIRPYGHDPNDLRRQDQR